MGCCVTTKANIPQKSNMESPNTHSSAEYSYIKNYSYITVHNNQLFVAEASQGSKLMAINEDIQLPENFAITMLSSKKLLIAGGKVASRLSKRTYEIDIRTKTAIEKSRLPERCKGGQLHLVGEKVYLVGTCNKHEEPLPIMVLEQETWGLLDLEGPLLKMPGSFLKDHSIYLLGGLIEDSPNFSIFCFDTYEGSFKECNTKLTTSLLNANCIHLGGNQALIAGGTNVQTMHPSQQAFIYQIDSSIKQILSAPNVLSACPLQLFDTIAVTLSYPNLLIFDLKDTTWTVKSVTDKTKLVTIERHEAIMGEEEESDIDYSSKLDACEDVQENVLEDINPDHIKIITN